MNAVQPAITNGFAPAAAAGGFSETSPIAAGETAYLNGLGRQAADTITPSPWGNPGFASAGNSAASWATGMGAGSSSAGNGGFLGLINNLIGQLGAMISQLSGSGSSAPAPTQNVANANFQSWGDPHLSETGTVNSGNGSTAAVNTHFDSMSGQGDLLDSADFAGGYQLSTTVTSPNANGVTHNQSATVSLNGGNDSVTLKNDGSYAIASGGTQLSINPGETLTLSGGACVACSANGKLSVSVQNANGGSIVTNLTAEGGGVDVSANVTNATVGGAIVAQSASAQAPQTQAAQIQTA